MKKIILFGSFFLSFVMAQDTSKVPDVLKGKTELKDPLGLRDPFKAPMRKKIEKPQDSKTGTLGKDNVYRNVQMDYGSIDPRNLTIVGVLVGKEKRAFAKSGASVVVLKEGMEIGSGTSAMILKAILPGGVVFVEKVVNVYGQEEYLETIIPITVQ
jgi:hypothetical protein